MRRRQEGGEGEQVGLLSGDADGPDAGPTAGPREPSVGECCRRTFPWTCVQLTLLIVVCVVILVSQLLDSFELEEYAYYHVKVKVELFDQATGEQRSSEFSPVVSKQVLGVGALESSTYDESYPESYTYNVWTGSWQLLQDNAIAMACLVILWSGLWPYVKLIILGFGLVAYKDRRLPKHFEWLSALAHWSFLDAWMVAITAVCIRFYYEGSETKSESDVLEIVVKITLELWAQAYAKTGAYCFFASIVLSQFVGFVLIAQAQTGSVAPRIAPDSASSHITRVLTEPQCLGWQTVGHVAQYFQIDLNEGVAKRWRAHAVSYGAGILLYVATFVILLLSYHKHIVNVFWDFYLEVEVEEDDELSFDKTYTFDKFTAANYSVYSALDELLVQTQGVGKSNKGLCYLGRLMIIVLPLTRVVVMFLIWSVPMPKVLHHLVRTKLQLLSIFVNHDVFALAYFILVPMGQLESLVKSEISGYSSIDDDGVTEDFTFTTTTNTGGCVLLLFAVLFENFMWIVTARVQNYYIENVWEHDPKQEGFSPIAQDEAADGQADNPDAPSAEA